MNRAPVVMGLDLSLSCTGLAVIDSRDWDCEAKAAECYSVAPKLPKQAAESDRINRLGAIAYFIRQKAYEHRVTHVFVEDYGFATKGRAQALGELGGVVKWMMQVGLHMTPQPVNANTARKLLLGNVPRSDVKVHVQRHLIQAGLRFDNPDEADAFVVANYGMSELGLGCLVTRGAA